MNQTHSETNHNFKAEYDSLLPLSKVIDRVNLSRPTIYRRMKSGDFPNGYKDGCRTLWAKSEIDAYVEAIKGGIKWREYAGKSGGTFGGINQ